MKLVAAKCPNCGANIDVDANSDSTKCEFCNTKILVDDAINKLRVELSGEVEVKNLPKVASYLKNGERYYKNGEYNEAYKQYNKAVELEPDNYEAVLRNGICNSLDTNYFGYNLNPLLSGIKEAYKLLGKDSDDEKYNQIASEGYKATKLMESFAIDIYNKGLLNYKDMIDNLEKLLDCMRIYSELVGIVRDDNIKRKILKSEVDLADYLIASKKYRTGRYKNGNEIIETFIPPKSVENSLYSMRNAAVNDYNKIVDPSKQLKTKKQPAIRWDGPAGKVLLYIIVFIILYFFIFSKIMPKSYSPTTYDHVQDCNGLKTVKLVDIYEEYNKDKNAAKEKYINKAFIFEGEIFRIDESKSMLQIESEQISPEVYINKNELAKLKKYKSGDKIKMCGVIKDKDTIVSVPILVENASIIDNKK